MSQLTTNDGTSLVVPALFIGQGKGRSLAPWSPGDPGHPVYGQADVLLQFLPKAGVCANRGCSLPQEIFLDKRAAGHSRWRTRPLCARCNSLWIIHKMTLADLVRLWRSQGKRCFNCRKALPDPRVGSRGGVTDIDHDHSIHPAERHSCPECRRGLACHGCNAGVLSRRWQNSTLEECEAA